MNINDHVWIKLTDLGRRIHEENHAFMKSKGYYTPPKEVNGWTKFQLWELMSEFGDHMTLGCLIPFETEIKLSDPNM